MIAGANGFAMVCMKRAVLLVETLYPELNLICLPVGGCVKSPGAAEAHKLPLKALGSTCSHPVQSSRSFGRREECRVFPVPSSGR